MGTIWIKEFTGGLDTRRMQETTAGGVLTVANDGHVSRGGEFEKRAAFVTAYTLPAGTVSIAANPTSIVVFGHLANPGVPVGVTYQRLIHPTVSSTALDRVLSWSLNAGKIYASAQFVDGVIAHYYDGANVTDWSDGRARASFRVISGTGTSTVTSITINGVEVLGATVTWTTNNSNTAALIASQINTFVSSPEYTAASSGDTVTILKSLTGKAPNGFPIVMTVTNNMTFSPATGLVLANGQDLSGTFQPGPFVQVYGSRELSVSGSTLYGSGIAQPTAWNTNTVGAFFIDMSAQAAGADQLMGVSEYQNLVAVFGKNVVMTWFIDSDPANNRKSQTLKNTGTVSGRSITQFGDQDLFYLNEGGLRSLKARDSSNAAATSDIGVPVDTIITAKLKTLNDTDRSKIMGLIEPTDGRFWLIMRDIIYVFSFFPGSKVSAWSTYSPGFAISDACTLDRIVYVRSGDTIYSYGGLDTTQLQYDDVVAEAWGPFLDAGAPTIKKRPTGLDVACIGLWDISIATDPTNADGEMLVASPNATTYALHGIATVGETTHIQPRVRSRGTGYRRLASMVIHYEGESPDED